LKHSDIDINVNITYVYPGDEQHIYLICMMLASIYAVACFRVFKRNYFVITEQNACHICIFLMFMLHMSVVDCLMQMQAVYKKLIV